MSPNRTPGERDAETAEQEMKRYATTTEKRGAADSTSRVALPPADRAPGFRRALGYEWTAFRTLRSNWMLMGAALVVQILLTAVAHDPRDHGDITFDKVLSVAYIFGTLVAALGVNAFGTEYRYGTITTTSLTVRPRARVLLAKMITVAVAAIVTEAVVLAASWLVLAVFFGAPPTPSTSLLLGTGFVLYIALITLIGLALAGLVRGSVLPIAVLVVWPQMEMFLINRLDLPPALLTALEPFYSASRLVSATPEWHLVLPLLVLSVVLLGAAAVALTRRDT
ncbi:ABC transporter permease [Saccharopolyspora shandongensis]|uniref:ABC transporter permease n=1 Tax=Saccharopolyspora shandongensis TaxID=418495 RepID=UPI0033F6C1D6